MKYNKLWLAKCTEIPVNTAIMSSHTILAKCLKYPEYITIVKKQL